MFCMSVVDKLAPYPWGGIGGRIWGSPAPPAGNVPLICALHKPSYPMLLLLSALPGQQKTVDSMVCSATCLEVLPIG